MWCGSVSVLPWDDEVFVDDVGRARWQRNQEVAAKLEQLGDFLIIGGYEERHATCFGRLAYAIAMHPESIAQLVKERRLRDLEGVNGTIAVILRELFMSGTCGKF